MANRAYLCVTNENTIYPAHFTEDYQPSKQLIASDVECIPVLWNALFREEDIMEREVDFEDDDDSFTVMAPICLVEDALAHLDDALPKLNEMFSQHGPLDDYVAMMRKALEQTDFKYVTIEIGEICDLYDDDRIEDMLRLAVRGWEKPAGISYVIEDRTEMSSSEDDLIAALDAGLVQFPGLEDLIKKGPEGDGPSEVTVDLSNVEKSEEVVVEGINATCHRDVLLALANTILDPDEKFPSVRIYLDDLEYTDDDQWNFTRFLGCGVHGSLGYGMEVPWEKEGADYGFTFPPEFGE